MKAIAKIFALLMLIMTVTGCETYKDPEVEYSPIYPLSGEWRVRITNAATGDLVNNKAMYTVGTYNTSDNSSSQMWIRITSNVAGGFGTLKAKIDCNVAGLGFSAAGAKDLHVTTNAEVGTVTITDGKVTLGSVALPSKKMSDRIYFKITNTKSGGNSYIVEGYRRTLYDEDDTVIDFK